MVLELIEQWISGATILVVQEIHLIEDKSTLDLQKGKCKIIDIYLQTQIRAYLSRDRAILMIRQAQKSVKIISLYI